MGHAGTRKSLRWSLVSHKTSTWTTEVGRTVTAEIFSLVTRSCSIEARTLSTQSTAVSLPLLSPTAGCPRCAAFSAYCTCTHEKGTHREGRAQIEG